uniref:Uncharacterized protein n=1 Tax=Rhizophora mucronata TaxID=61149 RepID=A0A2P2QE59_RHIMU
MWMSTTIKFKAILCCSTPLDFKCKALLMQSH